MGFSKSCKKFGLKKGSCSGECDASSPAPADCDDCVALGKVCIREHAAQKSCKALHYKKGKCEPPCVNTFSPAPSKCNQCDQLGARCVKELGFEKTCKKLDWSKKKGCSEE